jgi:hypothetical protein
VWPRLHVALTHIYIEQAYNGFTPHHEFVCNLGQLYIYMMHNVRGVSMYLARERLNQNDFTLLKITVRDFSRYIDINLPYTLSTYVREDVRLI